MKQYKKISLVFIVVCAAIAMFQIYWLTNSYNNQEELIEKKINIAFKESIQEIEIFVVKKDIAFTASLLNNFIPQYKLGYNTDTLNINEVKSKKEYINIKTIDSVFRKKILQTLPTLPIEFTVSLESIAESNNQTTVSNFFLTDKIATIQSKSVVYFVVVKNLNTLVLSKIKNQIAVAILAMLIIIFGSIYTYKMIAAQKQLLAYKNDFVTTITHELKTPIASVSVAIEAITKFGIYDDKNLTFKYLNASSNELNRLSFLVDRVLKLSAFEHNKIELQKEQFDLKNLIQEVVNTMQPQFEKFNALVAFNCTITNTDIVADKTHIKTVLFNLIDNAIKYCNRNPAINIELSVLNNQFKIDIQDNGIGIDEKYQSSIFDKFYRVPRNNVAGYGLGLSYVTHIMNLHNGIITVQSKINEGSTFTIILNQSI